MHYWQGKCNALHDWNLIKTANFFGCLLPSRGLHHFWLIRVHWGRFDVCAQVCHDAQARQGLHYALGPSKSFSQEPTLSLPSSDRSADALTNYPILARRLKRAGRILLRRQQGLSELHCGSARSLHLRWTASNQTLFSSQKPLSLSSLYRDSVDLHQAWPK